MAVPLPHSDRDLSSPFLVQTADPFQVKTEGSHPHHSSKVVFLVAHFPKLVAPFSQQRRSAKPAGGALGQDGQARGRLTCPPTRSRHITELVNDKLLPVRTSIGVECPDSCDTAAVTV